MQYNTALIKGLKMKRSIYTAGTVIFLLIAAGIFVLVPIFSAGIGGKRMPAFGKYDGTEIRYEQGSEFADYVSNYAENYKRMNRDMNDVIYKIIFRYAFNATVKELLCKKALRKSGYTVPAAAVNRAMRPVFNDENNNYSQRLYKQADPQRVADLRASYEKSLLIGRYDDDLFGGSEVFGKKPLYGIKTSDQEIQFIQNMSAEQRAFKAAAFNMNDYPDTEKSAFGAEHADKFIKYNLSIINCDDKAKADTLVKRLANAEIAFFDAVGEYSQKSYSDEDGKLRDNYAYQIEKLLVNAGDMEKIKALTEDGTSDVMQTSVGYSVFHVDGAAEQADFSDEETLKAVYRYLTTYEFSRIEEYYTKQAEAFIAAAKERGFSDACTTFGLKESSIPAFPLNYGNLSVLNTFTAELTALSAAAKNEMFLKAAFALNEDEVSEPLVMDKDIVILQRIAAEKNAEAIPAEAIADELKNYDKASGEAAITSNPKLEDNLDAVFENYIMKK